MKQSISLTVLAVACCGSAFAQTSPIAPGDRGAEAEKISFASLDANKDGSISEQEAKASVSVTAAFGAADKNGDKLLSKAEFDAYFAKQ